MSSAFSFYTSISEKFLYDRMRFIYTFTRLLTLKDYNCCYRAIHCSGQKAIALFSSESSKQKDWEKAVSAAEKVVGYPTSFMNLRFWLSDEMSNVAVNMRKLIGTKHPLMKTAKGLIFDDKESIQTRGLVVLLMSKAAGIPNEATVYEHHPLDITYSSVSLDPKPNGILPTQRSLAEITEMIHTAYVLHKGVMDISRDSDHGLTAQEIDDLLYGNKMALLSGDYLLAKASSGLAALGNTYVVEVMASAISDLMESQFMYDDLPSSSHNIDIDLWKNYTYKNGGCLYAKSCQSTLMLSGHSTSLAQYAFKFGQNFGLLRQLKADKDNDRLFSKHDVWSIYNILRQSEIDSLRSSIVDDTFTCLQKCNLQHSEAQSAIESFVTALST